MTDIQAPGTGTGDKIDLKEHLGALLLVTVHELVHDVATDYGTTDATRCTITALDGDHKGTTYNDTFIFAKIVQSQLRDALGGKRVLGRLEQGTAKKGQSAPWKLGAPTADDMQTVQKYDAYIATQKTPQAPATGDPF